MRALRTAVGMLAVVLLFYVALPAAAASTTNYSDQWFNPNEAAGARLFVKASLDAGVLVQESGCPR